MSRCASEVGAVEQRDGTLYFWLNGQPAPIVYGASTMTPMAGKQVVNAYTLTVDKTGNGTVVLDPAGGSYDNGTVVTLTATPDAGWHFVSWTGATPDGVDPLKATVTMDADKTVTATFVIDS